MTTHNVLKKMGKTIILASPRGFCAGVDRAIKIVEVALEKFGRPVYVRHEIVHNKRVVNGLAAKGAVFVKELDEVPSGSPVIFSAHGVAKTVHQTAKKLNMIAIDATCPLVTKVHICLLYTSDAADDRSRGLGDVYKRQLHVLKKLQGCQKELHQVL